MNVRPVQASIRASLGALVLLSLSAGFAPAQTPVDSGATIRTETKVVLVDAVVTDKKGNYLRDLTVKDFKVWEDNKEQSISSFSFEADPASPTNSQPRYIVLFFDNSTMDFGSQARAREAATKFIETNAGPNRLMAIANFGGALQIAQNFTSDADRLKDVVKGVKFSSVAPNDRGPMSLGRQAANFAIRDVILAIRDLAKNLATVPGRKSLILFTGGFPVTPDILSEVTATIGTCNKSNVAIYPIDVRGLVMPTNLNVPTPGRGPIGGLPPGSIFRNAGFMEGMAFAPQVRSPGPGTPATPSPSRPGTPSPTPTNPNPGRNPSTPTNPSNPGAPSRGTAPGGTLNNPNTGLPYNNPFNQPRNLLPKFPESATTNQNIMYMLAEGTGGFVIVNTNDLFGGLEKIGKELNEFYLLGYTPPESEEGSCHTLRVKVEHGANVRARTGYCSAKPKDLLASTPIEKTLETRVAAAQAGNLAATMQAPFFYTADNVARVNVAMDIPGDSFKFEKEKGKFHAVVNILGVANKEDGTVGARFSDSLKLDLEDKKQTEAFKEHPYHYENQFDIGPGKYTLKVVFSSGGENFGKVETALNVDPFTVKEFSVSPPAFSTHVLDLKQGDISMDVALIEDRTPLVSQGMQVIPSGTNRFRANQKAAMYVEVYEPRIVNPDPAKPVVVAIQVRVLDGKTAQEKFDTGLFRVAVPDKSGAPTIPLALQMPINTLASGSYRMEISAVDNAGGSAKRVSDFVIE